MRKIFDCGREGFISRFELMIAWEYLNDYDFYKTADPKFHLLEGLKFITDTISYLSDCCEMNPTFDLVELELNARFADNQPILDEIHRLLGLLRQMHPGFEDIVTFKEEYPYWERFVFLMKMKRDLGGLKDFSLDDVRCCVNKFKELSYYV